MEKHKQYMELALQQARAALAAGEFPVGCVIVAGDDIFYGGREKSAQNNEMDHAEIVALRRMYAKYPTGSECPLTVYSTMEPCLMCFSTLVLSNVRTMVYGYEDVMGGGTKLDLRALPPLYKAMQVEIIPHILRQECLRLFQDFFKDAGNSYLKGTLLAEHALAQEIPDTGRPGGVP